MTSLAFYLDTVKTLLPKLEKGYPHVTVDEVTGLLEVANDELVSLDAKERAKYTAKIYEYRGRVQVVKKRQAVHHATQARSARADSLIYLYRAQAQLAEAEASGTDTLGRLHGQGEQIKHLQDKVGDVCEDLTLSQRLTAAMSRWWR